MKTDAGRHAMMTVDVDRAERWPDLTETDRCDACGARAVGRAVLPDAAGSAGRQLLLCGHHCRQHGPTLAATGALLVVRPDDAATVLMPRPRHVSGPAPTAEIR
jgi:hypothetical protein